MALDHEVASIGGEGDTLGDPADGQFLASDIGGALAPENDESALTGMVGMIARQIGTVHGHGSDEVAIRMDVDGLGDGAERDVIDGSHRIGGEVHNTESVEVQSVPHALTGGETEFAIGRDDASIGLTVNGDLS